jgi:hypothetical protein
LVNNRLRAWLLIGLVAVLCGAAVWGVAWYRSAALTPVSLLQRIPRTDAVIVYLDFAALRRSGILAEWDTPKITEDSEYEAFVRKTDFDYKQDLDTALVAFGPTGKFLLLRGRFDWKTLRRYTDSEGGHCNNSLCQMPGSTPDRRISFFPLQRDLMALAVSRDESAAGRMTVVSGSAPEDVPNAPVWISIPNSVLKSGDSLPSGTRMFAHSMERAQSVVLSFVPDGKRLAAKLNIRCGSDREAGELASELSRTTGLLRNMILRENHQPNPADLSGVLSAGAFRSEGARVYGYWPIERAFMENLLGS